MMSNAVYPQLSGLSWSVIKTPMWSTMVQQSVSGKEVRTALQTFPRYNFQLQYEVLRASAGYPEYQALIDFFNARQGSYDDFLFTDPDDNAVVQQLFATGDGATKIFQLLRPLKIGGFQEPVQNLNGAPGIYAAGVLQTSGFSIGATGIVTFATAPASGVLLTWTGSYYFRCRFVNDSADFEQFMQDLWRLGKIEFISVKL